MTPTIRIWLRQRRWLSVALLVAAPGLPSSGPDLAEAIDFNRDIRPLLVARCFRCHGPDEESREADLRFDSHAAATRELDSGATAIVPGQPAASALIERITATDDEGRMPPAEAGPPLSQRAQTLLQQWIEQGAVYQRHWAFVPPRRPTVPDASRPAWVRGPIDRFVLARLDQAGLKPSPEADRYALARRVSLALTGLPPTLAEVQQLQDSPQDDWYAALVDRRLADSAYGQRWARVWLDLARYADSAGYAQDPPRTIWPYRDWVIRALNDNMPFDQFTIEQLAGDLLPHPTEEQLVATGFHRNTMTNSEGGTDDEEFRNAAVVDRVNTTMQVWMGLTMACAQCHDHKFDPISQEEYFRFFAVFNNTADADRGDESPTLELASSKGVRTPICRELAPDKRRKTCIQQRGNFRALGKEVTPGVPAALHPLPEGSQPSRLAIARWLVADDNPLTARVVVNRYWEQLFGTGLVASSGDFGRQGKPPTHPDLLDDLATELVARGWDTKWLVREMVTSATYRQSSRVTSEALARDPSNRDLARGPRFRLSAEQIRDAALSASGLLSHKMYGPSVHPARPALGLRAAFGGSTDWATSPGEDRYRRGLYTSWRRTTPYPSLTTFDAPSREVCTVRRIRTNTPLQALVTLNDPVFVEAAQALARRVVAEGGATPSDRARYGFRVCLARSPHATELARLVALYEKAAEHFDGKDEAAVQLATDPLGPLPPDQSAVELAAWTVVGNVLLNLDEFLMPP
jgi:hypothetical protein